MNAYHFKLKDVYEGAQSMHNIFEKNVNSVKEHIFYNK